jgi:hypothetical protein
MTEPAAANELDFGPLPTITPAGSSNIVMAPDEVLMPDEAV